MTSASSDTFYAKVLPVLTGFGVAAAVALAGVSLPILIGQGRDVQKLQDQMEMVRGDVTKFQATADRLDKHMTEAESDPGRVLAQTLGTSAVNKRIGTSIVIGGEIYVFPKDAAAQTSLIAAGYREKELSPTISGFVASVPAAEFGPVQHPGR